MLTLQQWLALDPLAARWRDITTAATHAVDRYMAKLAPAAVTVTADRSPEAMAALLERGELVTKVAFTLRDLPN